MRTLLLLFAVVLAAAPASAQRLSVTPDTLRFDGPAVLSMALRNDTSVPVAFDSLRFERLSESPETAVLWNVDFRILQSDGFYEFGSFSCFVDFPLGGARRYECAAVCDLTRRPLCATGRRDRVLAG